jgi:hypothetical protein
MPFWKNHNYFHVSFSLYDSCILGILFGGFYISVGNLPIVANWIPYLTFLRWGYEALTINEYRGLTFTCNDNLGVTQNNDTSSCILTGEQELQILTFNNSSTGLAVLGLGEFMAFHCIVFNSKLLIHLNLHSARENMHYYMTVFDYCI